MKRLTIVFAVLFIFSVSADAQMGGGMKPDQKGPMGQGHDGRRRENADDAYVSGDDETANGRGTADAYDADDDAHVPADDEGT